MSWSRADARTAGHTQFGHSFWELEVLGTDGRPIPVNIPTIGEGDAHRLLEAVQAAAKQGKYANLVPTVGASFSLHALS